MFRDCPIQPQPAFRVAPAARALHFSLLVFFSPKKANWPKNSVDFGTRLRAIELSRFRRSGGLVRDVCRSACVLACLLACSASSACSASLREGNLAFVPSSQVLLYNYIYICLDDRIIMI